MLLPFILVEHSGEAKTELISSFVSLQLGGEVKVLSIEVHKKHARVGIVLIFQARVPCQTIETEHVSGNHTDYKVRTTSPSKGDTVSNDAHEQRDRMVQAATRMHDHELMCASNDAKHSSHHHPPAHCHI